MQLFNFCRLVYQTLFYVQIHCCIPYFNYAITSLQKDYGNPNSAQQYTGTFVIDKHTTSISWPPPRNIKDTSDTTIHCEVNITYTKGDVIEGHHITHPGTFPALTFSYSDGSSEKIGLSTSGILLRRPYPSGGDAGGFVGTDSINHQSYANAQYIYEMTIITGHRK